MPLCLPAPAVAAPADFLSGFEAVDLCAVGGFNAMVANDGWIKGMEAGFRDALKKQRDEAKADFMRRATVPYHD